jgi:hypothetical protein
MQIPKFIPKLGLVYSIVVHRTLSRKGFVAHLNITFSAPNSFTRGKGPALE